MITIFDQKWRISEINDHEIRACLNGKSNTQNIPQDLLDWLKLVHLIIPEKIVKCFSIRTIIEDIQVHVLIDFTKTNPLLREKHFVEKIIIKIQNKSRFIVINSYRNKIVFYRDRHLYVTTSSEEDAKYLKAIVLMAL